MGRKGLSSQPWIVGGKLGLLLDQLAQTVDQNGDRANLYHGHAFQQIVDALKEEMVVLADQGFANLDWHPINLRLCQPGLWNQSMMVASV